MKLLKDFGKTIAHVCILFGLLVAAGNALVVHGVKAQSSWLNAAQLESLRLILNTTGVAVWQNSNGEPYTCDSNSTGGYYFDTGTVAFRVCDGVGWADGGGGVGALNDLSDVTISAPTNGQHLVYNGSNWANAASSASNLNDLADVFAPTPVDGDIIQYDGVTDNRWESIAGASPTTLAGLSDVTLATPGEGETLMHNGTNWLNQNTTASYWLFPSNDNQWAGHTFVDDQICAADNDVRVFRVHLDLNCDVDRILWALEFDSTNCNNGAFALYSLDGNTKVVDSGAATYAGSGTIIDQNITPVFVFAGDYWLAYTSNECSTSCRIGSEDDPTPISAVNMDALLNQNQTLIGTAANQSVAGAMPATLGIITANNNVERPVVKFQCVDP